MSGEQERAGPRMGQCPSRNPKTSETEVQTFERPAVRADPWAVVRLPTLPLLVPPVLPPVWEVHQVPLHTGSDGPTRHSDPLPVPPPPPPHTLQDSRGNPTSLRPRSLTPSTIVGGRLDVDRKPVETDGWTRSFKNETRRLRLVEGVLGRVRKSVPERERPVG